MNQNSNNNNDPQQQFKSQNIVKQDQQLTKTTTSMIDKKNEQMAQDDGNKDNIPLILNQFINTLKRKVSDSEQNREQNIRSIGGPKMNFELTQNERLWLMKQMDQFIDSVIVTVDGHQERIHMDILLSLNGNIQQSMNFIADLNSTTKQYQIDPQISTELLKYLIQFAYQRQFTLNDGKIIIEIADYASKYQIETLIKYCMKQFLENLQFDNALKGYELALKFKDIENNDFDMNKFKDFIEDNFEEILFKSKTELLKKDFHLIFDLLSSQKLNLVNEEIVWNVICDWIMFDQFNRFDYLTNFLQNVLRLGRLSDTFLKNDVLEHELFQQLPRRKQNDFKKFLDENFQLDVIIDGYGLGLSEHYFYLPRETKELLLVAGGWVEGQTTNSWEIYDYQTNLWLLPGITLNKKISYFGLEIVDDTVYVFGGSNGREIYDSLQTFNLNSAERKWETKCSMLQKRCYVSSCSLNNLIYAIGGFNQQNRMRNCERYRPSLDIWQEIAELNYARSDASCTAHDGKIFVAGGINDSCIERTVEVFYPEENVWRLIKSMKSPRTSFAIASFMNMVWALGGNNGTTRSNSVECYDPESDTWIEMPSMLTRRSTFRAQVLRNELYVVGGYNGQSPICNVEKFIPDKGWIKVKELRHDRSGLSLISLPNKFKAMII